LWDFDSTFNHGLLVLDIILTLVYYAIIG
jgi:hypothetical protein